MQKASCLLLAFSDVLTLRVSSPFLLLLRRKRRMRR
jgi:hypothetical protein